MSGTPIHILLVEDNPGDVALLKITLSEESDERVVIETASRVTDAARMLDADGFDVVLLDLTLPDASGTEALVRLQSHVSRVPIIVQTGTDDDELAVKAMQLGAQDYITKGKSDGRILMRRIRQAIERTRTARADEEDVLSTGKPIIGKMEKETFPDGHTTWALTTKMPLKNEAGEIIGTFGVSRDITGLKSAEIALRSSEERYIRLLDSVTDYVYTVVLDQGGVISTQHGAGCRAVTGYSPEEFEKDTMLWHRIIFPEDRDAVVKMAVSAVKDDTPFEVEHRLVRKDGQIRWVRNKHVPRRNATGRIVAYDGLMSDITEKKHADDDLRAAQSQLMQAEKLHSIGQLAAGVAHEVKNPLQVILIGLQFVSDSPVAADPQMRAVIQEMLDAVQRANGVIQDLLDFASPRELGMQPRSLNALLEKALRFVRHDITKSDIKVVKHLAEGLPEAIVDPTKIEQAFINLITNACHAMPGGGTLTVTTRERVITAAESPRHDSGDRSGIRFRAGEPVITIEIRDTGVGVAPEKLSRIFEPFFTTKSTGKGTGLGLSVTQKIVDLHRGKISIENHPEGGVIASITLKAIKQGDDARKERP